VAPNGIVLITMGRLRVRKFGFTLVELLIVIIVIAVLSAIAIPRAGSSSLRNKEASLRANLKLLREAGDRCEADTGVTVTIPQLASRTAPATGWVRGRMGNHWTVKAINPSDWKGPYIDRVPVNPFTGTTTYTNGATSSTTISWTHYSAQTFNSSYYYYPSTSLSSVGSAYRTW
jgi:prepilin-type N-terminal cleavage/methylation domain-containing protein